MKMLHLPRILSTLILLISLVFAQAAMPLTVAACGNGTNSSQDQVLNGVGETGSGCSDTGVTNTLSTAVSVLSYVVGIASVPFRFSGRR